MSHIQWTPVHCDIRDNVLADLAAKFTTTYTPSPKAVTLTSACAAIRKVTRDPTPHPGGVRYAYYSRDREACVLFRADPSLLDKLRSGRYMGLMAHRA